MAGSRVVSFSWVLVTALCSVSPRLEAADNAALPFPPQLEVVVPYQPTAFLSDGRQRLVYELVLRNFEGRSLELQQLAVLNADDAGGRVLEHYDTSQLQKMIRTIGTRSQDAHVVTVLAGGSSAVIYLLLTFNASDQVPKRLQHRLVTSAGEIVTTSMSTHHDALQVLGPPVTGGDWLAETGLSNDNGHRRGNLLLHGKSVISRRYAFDWVKVEHGGAMYKGDKDANTSYRGYGEKLIAVADATVVSLTDGIPQNVPGRRPAVAFDKIAGNSVTLDIGRGHYAHYMHLQPGTMRVRVGDHVRRGQVLGLLGNSGDSFVPHLHFEITTSPILLAGEGVPYVFDSFVVLDSKRGLSVKHEKELPAEKMQVDFGN